MCLLAIQFTQGKKNPIHNCKQQFSINAQNHSRVFVQFFCGLTTILDGSSSSARLEILWQHYGIYDNPSGFSVVTTINYITACVYIHVVCLFHHLMMNPLSPIPHRLSESILSAYIYWQWSLPCSFVHP